MKDKKILITGGAGYIGSVLVRKLLDEDYQVTVIDNLRYGGKSLLGVHSKDNFEFKKIDVREENKLKKALNGVDSVVHLAALVGDPLCSKEQDEAREVNLAGTKKLIRLVRQSNVEQFIFASTCSNYGISNVDELATEETELNPVSLYAKTKVKSEKELFDESGPDLVGTVLRFATVFGLSPRMRFDLTVNHFTKDALEKGELVIYGKDTWRPYVHVSDVAQAVVSVLKADSSKINREVFNVGSNENNYQKGKIAEEVKNNIPSLELEYMDKDLDDPRNYRVSFNKIESVLDFDAKYTVEDGIKEVKEVISSGLILNPESEYYYNVK